MNVADIETLITGLRSAGYTVNEIGAALQIYTPDRDFFASVNTTTKKITYRGELDKDQIQGLNEEVARAYSRGCVVAMAKKYGWKTVEKKSKAGNVMFEVQRQA